MPAGKVILHVPSNTSNPSVSVSKPKTRRTRTKKTKASKKLVKIIKNVIHQEAETKQAYTSIGDSLVFYNSGINSSGDILSVLPSISKGSDDNQRIGDQIRAMSLNIKGYIKLNIGSSLNQSSLPNVIARLFVVSLKTQSNFTGASGATGALSGLLKKGGTTTAFSGVLSDIYAPVNTDLWTVHADKKFYLSQDYLQQVSTTQTSQIVARDIRNTVKFFNIKVKCKNKLLKYDSNITSGLLPVNFAPIIMLGYAYLDGSSPDVLYSNIGLQYDSVFNYEDM